MCVSVNVLQSRPKLRTRRTVEYASSEHDAIDEDEGVDEKAADEDGEQEDESESVEEGKLSTAPFAKKRRRTQQADDEEEEYEPQTDEQVGCIWIRFGL